MDSEPTHSEREPSEEGLPKIAAIKMAVREGGKRMLDNINPSFVELVKDSPSLKGEASNATYHIMEAHNLTLEEISCLLFASAYLDQTRLHELQAKLEKATEAERKLKDKLRLTQEELNAAQEELERVQQDANREFKRLRDAHSEVIKEYDDYRKKSVYNDQTHQLTERNTFLEEDNLRLRKERNELRTTDATLRARIRTLEQTVQSFQSSMRGVYRQIAPFRYQLDNRAPKNLQQFGRPHSDPSICVVNEGNSRYYANSRRPGHNPSVTARDATTDAALMTRRGHRVDPLADGSWRTQPRLRPPDEQVVGTYPLIPTLTPLRSPPITSSSSRLTNTTAASQSIVTDGGTSTVESNRRSFVGSDFSESSLTTSGGDQVQNDGGRNERGTQLVCPVCGVTPMGDVLNVLSHMSECRME